MTKQEFIEKYSYVKFVFFSYNKFTFNFRGISNEGYTVTIGLGGNSDAIYRLEVVPEFGETINDDFDPHQGSVYNGNILIEDFYAY